MTKQVKDVAKKEDEKFCIKGEVKVDWSKRDHVFEVKHNGVSLDWTANYQEAVASQKATQGSQLFQINMGTGQKTLRA